jgi:hypothetical protein
MRSQNAAIYRLMTESARWTCKGVAIGHPFCSLMLILLLVIVSLFACTMMEAQSLAESNAREVGVLPRVRPLGSHVRQNPIIHISVSFGLSESLPLSHCNARKMPLHSSGPHVTYLLQCVQCQSGSKHD